MVEEEDHSDEGEDEEKSGGFALPVPHREEATAKEDEDDGVHTMKFLGRVAVTMAAPRYRHNREARSATFINHACKRS